MFPVTISATIIDIHFLLIFTFWISICVCLHEYVCIYTYMYAYICAYIYTYELNWYMYIYISSVQFSSVAQFCLTSCYPKDHSTPDFPVHHQLPKFTQTHVHWVGDVIQSSHPLSFPSSPAFNLSQQQGLFKWVSFWHHVAKVWSFSFNISPSNEHPGLISFRMHWKGLSRIFNTTVQKNQFFSVQLTSIHDHWKNHSLDKWTFVGKAMSLLFRMLSRLVIPFFPMSKCLLILWLQSPSAVILEPPKIKSAPVSTDSPSICHEVMGPEAMILVFWMLSFKPTFHSPLSLSSRGSLVPLCFLP